CRKIPTYRPACLQWRRDPTYNSKKLSVNCLQFRLEWRSKDRGGSDDFCPGRGQRKRMYIFQLALTGDMLEIDGTLDSHRIGLDKLESAPHIHYHFLRDLGPQRDDPDYWKRFYSLLIN